jgi:hypothetical protein
MLTNYYNPHEHEIDKIVLGSGDWIVDSLPSEKDVVSQHLPFYGVVAPIRTIEVKGLYSLDGEKWSPQFPLFETIEAWKKSSDDVVSGIISFRLEIIPDETLSIRELGFFVGEQMVIYKVIKEFLIGKVHDHEKFVYKFNYNLKCNFVTGATINSLIS